ncbi:MAG: retention module-containing protein, partial [Pseudohaliea sp.]
MATAVIATVTAIEGTAYARSAEGELRELRVGDELRQGETLVTPEGSSVELESAEGEAMVVAQAEELAISADMLTRLAASADEAAVREATLDEVIAALDGDGDLSEVLDAPAAGGDAGTNAGSSFIRLARISEETPEFSGLRDASGADASAFVEQGEPIIGADLRPDEATTPEEQPVTIPVLDNDDFVEGAIVSAVSVPQNGAASINEDGTVTYTPDPGFTGQDTFTYTAITPDGNVTGTTTVTVDVTPTSEPPPPPPELPALSIGDAVVIEGDTAEVTVTLSSPSDSTVTVSFASADGTATVVGGDYDPVSGTLSFAPGETGKTILVQTNSDDLEEGTEFLNLELTAPDNAVIADGAGIVEITDDFTPAPPSISIDDVTVTEGQAAQFTLTLSNPVDSPVTVAFATADGSAVSGADYDPNSGTVTFAPGSTTATVTVQTNEDDLAEGTENAFVNLSNPGGATIADGTGTLTITDGSEPPPPPPQELPTLAIGDSTVVEGDTAEVTVTLSSPSDSTVTVSFASADGTATVVGGDYDPVGGTLSFAPGETGKTILVQTNSDDLEEGNENALLNLNSPVGATIADGTGTITIIDGSEPPPPPPDNDPPVAIDDAASTAEDTAVTFSITGNDSDPDGSIDPATVVVTGGP